MKQRILAVMLLIAVLAIAAVFAPLLGFAA